jgi:hypothetical protein
LLGCVDGAGGRHFMCVVEEEAVSVDVLVLRMVWFEEELVKGVDDAVLYCAVLSSKILK